MLETMKWIPTPTFVDEPIDLGYSTQQIWTLGIQVKASRRRRRQDCDSSVPPSVVVDTFLGCSAAGDHRDC